MGSSFRSGKSRRFAAVSIIAALSAFGVMVARQGDDHDAGLRKAHYQVLERSERASHIPLAVARTDCESIERTDVKEGRPCGFWLMSLCARPAKIAPGPR